MRNNELMNEWMRRQCIQIFTSSSESSGMPKNHIVFKFQILECEKKDKEIYSSHARRRHVFKIMDILFTAQKDFVFKSYRISVKM